MHLRPPRTANPTQLRILLLVTLLPIGALGLAGGILGQRLIDNTLAAQSRAALNRTDSAISQLVHEVDQTTLLLAHLIALQGFPTEEELQNIRALPLVQQRLHLTGRIELFDEQGTLVADNGPERINEYHWVPASGMPSTPKAAEEYIPGLVRTSAGVAIRASAPIPGLHTQKPTGTVVVTAPLDNAMLAHLQPYTQAKVILRLPGHSKIGSPSAKAAQGALPSLYNGVGIVQYKTTIANQPYAVSAMPLYNNNGERLAMLTVGISYTAWAHISLFNQPATLILLLLLCLAAIPGLWIACRLCLSPGSSDPAEPPRLLQIETRSLEEKSIPSSMLLAAHPHMYAGSDAVGQGSQETLSANSSHAVLDSSSPVCNIFGKNNQPEALSCHEALYLARSPLEDTTERRLRRQAEQQREAAEAANKAKSEFLARMSHEVRTPLNAVIGMADILWETEMTAEQRLYVDIFRKSGQTLLDLLNDILDYSRLEAGKLPLENKPFALRSVFCMAVDMYRAQAQKKMLKLTLTVANDLPDTFLGDSLRLRQILANLVSNAIKFTESGEVIVQVARAPGPPPVNTACTPGTPLKLRISVSDTGIGIPDNVQQAIFNSFTQADTSITRRFGGTGLGLAICKMLTAMMHGFIWLESTYAKGTTMYVEIPLEIHASITAEPQYAEVTATLAPAPLRILLVEDSDNNRLLFKLYLKGMPHTVDEAENGQEGVNLFEQHTYDIIFMDLEMPVMDGYKATSAIRSHEEQHNWPPTPIVALTAHALAGFKQRCLALGFTDYLTKPFRKPQLLALLTRNTDQEAESVLDNSSNTP